MAFLRAGLSQDVPLIIRGDDVTLRPLVMTDYSEWAEIRTKSRDHLGPWEPAWPRDELSKTSFRRRIRHYQREAREDLGYAFTIVDEADGSVSGGVTLSNVRRGVTQAASLGYWLSVDKTGVGLMSRSVKALIPFSFEELRLHRIEAACMPDNLTSLRVLERCGFRKEGLARKYLKINGAWRDHVLFAMIVDDFNAGEWPGDAL
ncbi:MAG: GNAT family protein [Pseudomonadota bacterium]